MKCYLCGSEENTKADGKVRNDPSIEILRCDCCDLVFLSSSKICQPENN